MVTANTPNEENGKQGAPEHPHANNPIKPIKLINDETVNPDTGDPIDDKLSREPLAEAIAGVIIGTKPPFTVGIYGKWGSGKTHFMQTVKTRIEPKPEQKQLSDEHVQPSPYKLSFYMPVALLVFLVFYLAAHFLRIAFGEAPTSESVLAEVAAVVGTFCSAIFVMCAPSLENAQEQTIQMQTEQKNGGEFREGPQPITVWYEAWRHSNEEHPELSMLMAVREKLKESGRINHSIDKSLKDILFTTASAASLAVPTPVGNVTFSGADVIDSWRKLRHFKEKEAQVKIYEQYMLALRALAHYDDVSYDPKLAAQPGYKDDLAKVHRIVFFIDDLDRCTPKTVVSMLERIKLYLWHPQCVFVLGADKTAIEEALRAEKIFLQGADKKEDDYTKSAKEYLEKIVNFPFRIPPLTDTNAKKFIGAELDELWEVNGVELGDTTYRDQVSEFLIKILDDEGASLRNHKEVINIFAFNSRFVLNNWEGEAK